MCLLLRTESMTPTKKILGPTIEPGCIACGSCQFIAPEIFEVTDRSRVNPSGDLEANEERIKRAAVACPVQVIKLTEKL